MIQLNWYKIFGESHQIPDGRTVTPTDDIQIWLHCADIWDKTYTTLAEVLADTSTLVMLMAIDNAVDYLVRSTTWATAQALVPTMTDNTHPSGEAFTNSPYASTYPAYLSFDGDNTTYTSGNAADGFRVGYIFPTVTALKKVYVHCLDMSSFKIQYSNDGITWTDATSATSISTEYSGDLSSVTTARYFSLLALATSGNGHINSLQFYAEGICDSEIAMKSIGASDYASTKLLADSTWNSAIQNSPYFEWVDNIKVPILTEDTAQIIFSDELTAYGRQAYKAYDNDNSTCWESNTIMPAYIGYDFENDVQLGKLSIYLHALWGSSLISTINFKLQKNVSGVWTDIADLSAAKDANNIISKDFAISNSGTNEEYRLYCPTRFHVSSENAYFSTLQFYGREIGGVQTWLRSANITDKTYTTLAEVLADSTTLSALMSNHNAVDYLVTAKGWADDICADSTAMTLIGNDNYCADTLLADATWCEAILNSTYVESVMNVKIPVMTSNTQPYGECFAGSSYTDYPAWKAFNGDANSFWNSNSTSANGVWVGYKFVSKSKIRGYKILSGSAYNSYAATGVSFKIQGSDDSFVGDIHDLDTQSGLNFSDYKPKAFAFSGEENYTQFRVLYSTITTPTTYKGVTSILQFYGREDV